VGSTLRTPSTVSLMLPYLTNESDPASHVLVYVFKILSDRRSVAVWRKRVPLPANILGRNSGAISARKRQLKDVEAGYVIKIRYAH
jgi:hypothetical protein